MLWIQSLDTALFRFINESLANPVLDRVMPFASGNPFFAPALLLAALLLVWKGGKRGWLCLLMLALIIGPCDGLVINTLKHAIARPRPFVALEKVRFFGVQTTPSIAARMGSASNADDPAAAPPNRNSMPSSHAANWFAASMILWVYYRRSWRFMVPLAGIVSFSRVYNGVHYPSDVLVGAGLGAGYAVAGIWAVTWCWRWAGQKWFPLWWQRAPSLVNPDAKVPEAMVQGENLNSDSHWLRLGYVLIAATLLCNLLYLASGAIELSGDEAYQWVWSKHLALSYYSKPPMIAWLQFLGTWLWGDTEFGVRFCSPVIGAVLGLLLLRFFTREVSARMGFMLLLILEATPLLAAGSILMTIDPPSVLFWTAAMLAGWRAAKPDGTTKHWCWAGLWMALGFLSKYTELFQLLSWAVFFALWKPARAHWRRPGPYLALLINLLGSLPVLIWNHQHGWITLTHVAERGGAGQPWQPTLRFLGEFIAAEALLLNPFFVFPAIWAAVAFWKRDREDARMVYLFSMGAPLFLCYLLFTLRARVLPNWIAPSVIPLFCLSMLYWEPFLRASRTLRTLRTAGVVFGLALVALMHDTDLVKFVTGHPLPAKIDPLTRVRGNAELARLTGEARQELQAREGKPAFIIGGHYGITGEISFYLPEARTNIVNQPLVYCIATPKPENQFYFWPGYQGHRNGDNAIYVRELPLPTLKSGWVRDWLRGHTNLDSYAPFGFFPPPSLTNEFESVTDLGLRSAVRHGNVVRTVQLFECRHLK